MIHPHLVHLVSFQRDDRELAAGRLAEPAAADQAAIAFLLNHVPDGLAGIAFAGLGVGPRARLLLVLALIAVYVPVAGAGPSIQRAAVMGAAGIVTMLLYYDLESMG